MKKKKTKAIKKRGIQLSDSEFSELIGLLVYANRIAKREDGKEYKNMIYYMKHDIIKYLITDHREKLKIFKCFDNEHRLFHIQIGDVVFHVPYGVRYGIKFDDLEEIEYKKELNRDLTCPYSPKFIFTRLLTFYACLNGGIENIKSGVIKFWVVNEVYKLSYPENKSVEIKRENEKQSNNPGPNTEYCLVIDGEIKNKDKFSMFWNVALRDYHLIYEQKL